MPSRSRLPHAGLGLLAALALAGCTRVGAPARPSPPLGGWITYWALGEGLAGLGAPDPRPADVFLFVAQLDEAGNPVPAWPGEDYAPAVAAIRATGATPWLTVVNDRHAGPDRSVLKDPEIVHDVLADPERRRAHRQGLVALARRLGVAGVDVDYERVHAADRLHFTRFVEELDRDLAAAGLKLSVTVPPRTSDKAGEGAGTSDWRGICAVADRLQIMLYNEHSGATPPGPLATASWMERVLRHAGSRCPAGVVVAAVKVVGMEWGPDGTRDIRYAEAVALAAAERAPVERHPDGDVPWFTYGPEAGRRTVFYEDARSLRAKLTVATRHGVSGVVLWTLGAEDAALWRE